MFDADRWVEIWVTITRNKTRSALTCFGVFWGILMLIILLGSGAGLKNGIFSGVDGFATNSLFLWSDRTSEPYKGFNKSRFWSLRNRDIEDIKKNVPGVEYISPMIWGAQGEKNIVYEQKSGSYSMRGIYPEYFKIESQNIYYGRVFNEVDQQEKRKVCVIGSEVNKVLFNSGDPCGKYIRANGIYYQIIGVVKEKANVSIGSRASETVFIPFSTMQQTLNQGDILHFLAMTVKRDYVVKQVLDEVTGLIKANNSIAPTDPQAVGVMNMAAEFETFDNLFVGIDILVWLVGMGTLLAGIIGVSNIMMVTVKERTNEIGVRRALGAKPWNIISQVMSESLLLTSLAGLMGLSLGVFILDLANKALSAQPPSDGTFFLNPEVSIQTAIAATVVLLISGLFAGLIPAWRAMQIKAIDAIREE